MPFSSDSPFGDRRLAMMQLSDSFFPSGSFTLSHGLESLVATGQVRSPEEVQTYLRVLLHNKVATSDLVALSCAYRGSEMDNLEHVRVADEVLFAYTPIEGARDAQKKSGRALLMVARSTWPNAQLDLLQADVTHQRMHGLHPIIFAVVGRAANLAADETILAFLHSWLTGLAGVAIRLGVLGHINAQLVLKSLAPDLEQVARVASHCTLDNLWSCTPAIDIAQMTHQQLPQRLFTN
jgi:urease accessory protein